MSDQPDITLGYIASVEEGFSDGPISIDDLVFLDEAGAKLSMSSDFARTPIDEHAAASEPKIKGKTKGVHSLLFFDSQVRHKIPL